MVGVPGRSKGCSTCRRRKKGCDLVRPSCSQCVRAGIQCEGYERTRIFVNSTPDAASRGAGPAPAYTTQDVFRFEAGNGTGQLQRRPVPTPARARAGAAPVEVVLPDGLRRTAYTEKYLGIFWNMMLPQGRTYAVDAGYASGSWTGPVQALHGKSTLVDAALMANCLLRMGNESGDRWMLEESFRLYLSALRAIRGTLKAPKKALSDETLAAIKLMLGFEMFRPADSANQLAACLNHIDAHWPLLQARGPKAHIEGNGYHMFVAGRVSIIISCLIDRRKCPLATKAWKTIPWSKMPKSPKEHLVDVFIDLPGIIEDADALKALPPAQIPAKHAGLLARCWALDAALLNWRETVSPMSDWTDILSQKPEDFTAKDLYDVYLASLYLSISVLLYSIMHALAPGQLPERMKLSGIIETILQSMKLLFTPVAGALSADASVLPLAMVLQYVSAMPAAATQYERDTLVDLYHTPTGRQMAVVCHFKDVVAHIIQSKAAEAAQDQAATAVPEVAQGQEAGPQHDLARYENVEYENARDMLRETEQQRIATEQWRQTQQKAKAKEAKVLDDVHTQMMVVGGDAEPAIGRIVEKKPPPLHSCRKHAMGGDHAWADDGSAVDEEGACDCYGGHRKILLGDIARQVKIEKGYGGFADGLDEGVEELPHEFPEGKNPADFLWERRDYHLPDAPSSRASSEYPDPEASAFVSHHQTTNRIVPV